MTRGMRLLLIPLMVAVLMGLAPLGSEPHLVGKLRWVAGGAVGMAPMDWFDLLMHAAPIVWLAVNLVRWWRGRAPTKAA